MQPRRVYFDHATGRFVGITAQIYRDLVNTYPLVRVEEELNRMRFWLREHPERTGNLNFIAAWLNRANRDNHDAHTLETVARYNCTIKGRVVEEDPLEKNKRRVLNYGHTVGHAVESASDYALLHGEAIAVGMIAAGLIEIELGFSEPDRLDRIRRVLEKLGVPVKLPPNLAEDRIVDVMRHDKKAVDQWPRFVLIDRLGQVHCEKGQYAVQVSRDVVEKVLKLMIDD